MAQEEKLLLLINNYNFVIHQEPATEVIDFHFAVNLDREWEDQTDSRLNYLAEYFREHGGLNYLTLAANYDDQMREAVFNVQLNKQFIQRLYTALPQPMIVFSGTVESQPQPGSPYPEHTWLINAPLYVQELITAENWRENGDFYNATFSVPLVFVDPNVVVNGLPLALANPITPPEISGCLVRFNLLVEWNQSENIQISSQYFLEKLFEDEATTDLTIVAWNRAEIKCHRSILSAHSPVFSRMLFSQNPTREAISGRFEMSENSQVGVQTLIKYLYGIPIKIEDVSVDVAVELIQTAHKYDLNHLEGSLIRLFMTMELGWFTPDDILELYLFVKKLDSLKDLRERCVLLMTGMDTQDFRACEQFKKMDALESADLLFEMVESLKHVP